MKSDYFDAESPLQEGWRVSVATAPSASISAATIHVALKARKQLRRHFMTLPGPLFLFFVFIAMILTHTPIHQVYVADHGVSTALNPKASDVMQSKTIVNFMKIRDIDDVPRWLNNSVLPAVFTNSSSNGTILPPELRGRVSAYNQLVGAVDISVFNTVQTKCQSDSPLAKRYGPCFDFDLELDITAAANNSERNLRRGPGSWYTLYIATANPDVYGRLARWQREGSAGGYYLSMATREVLVKITTYNGQLDMFTYQVFKIEVEAGGACSPSYKVLSVPTNPYSSSSINLILDILVGLLVLQILGRRLWMLKRQIRGQDAWSCDIGKTFIEWCSIIMVIVYYSAWFQVCNKFFASHFEDDLAELTKFYDDLYTLPLAQQRSRMGESNQPKVSDFIDTFGPAIEFVYIVSIVTCLQLVVHVMAAFQFHPTMNILTNTIVSSVKRLGSFLFIFMLIVMALATSGCLLFGPQLEEFSRLDRSMVTCINMLFGGYSYDLIKDVNELAIVWFWVSQSIVTLVLVNIMLAVVITSHQEIVDVNLGKRSFVGELALVARDVFKIYVLRRPDLFKKLTDRMEILMHEVWTTTDVASALNISELRAEKLITKLKQYAASVDVDESEHGPNAITAALEQKVGGQVLSLDHKVHDIDAKLNFLVEYIKQQQQRQI
ncbi:Polycystin Cation Channel (PCC) Family [Achlya hypogyna]|uniref:Polycystin Cation Channel (PCC) Family n=1 Tax=Achlya hypogyna TaxID=1202772 RepID=A0A1V9YNH7_ACHHY|nr:Polycystin Cation Channel (PCC) Family [Achlya hypogyna]